MKKITITLDTDQYEILQSLKGMGTKDAEKIKNVVISYFSEKSYIKTASNVTTLKKGISTTTKTVMPSHRTSVTSRPEDNEST